MEVKKLNEYLISYCVREHLAGSQYLEPHLHEAAKKYLEALDVFAKAHIRTYTPGETKRHRDTQTLDRAIDAFGSGRPHHGVQNGVRRVNLPSWASLGEYVTVSYSSVGTIAKVGGFVAHLQEFPLGKAMVIELRDSWNSYHPAAWRYLSLWMPSEPSALAGFL